ncbi:hypothetical protein BV898_04537 [Hypsibius exemplaris]|uniref:Uncharacterized protein n=1 Tax=Hypsibius exemplaris TaxID=2072580 RepID=A0A1W0X2D0_HYPEX|nr:hypothetical protein BV898_04537 [Hypsibius exemplaris]
MYNLLIVAIFFLASCSAYWLPMREARDMMPTIAGGYNRYQQGSSGMPFSGQEQQQGGDFIPSRNFQGPFNGGNNGGPDRGQFNGGRPFGGPQQFNGGPERGQFNGGPNRRF